MKKNIMLATAVFSLSIVVNAQQPLPYSTGFDNATEKAGWQSFREGATDALNWTYGSEFALYTPPLALDYIQHSYPYSNTVLTDDWKVSPALDFSSGAKLALKINVYSPIAATIAGDTIECYLLTGSPNPQQATLTLLASFNNLIADDYNLKDTANISIPPTSGNAYIAFRYTCFHDWYTVAIDDISITADNTPPPPNGIKNIKSDVAHFEIYPNPATTAISWNFTERKEWDKHLKGQILDNKGKILRTFRAAAKQLDIHTLSPGLYYLKIQNNMKPFIKK